MRSDLFSNGSNQFWFNRLINNLLTEGKFLLLLTLLLLLLNSLSLCYLRSSGLLGAWLLGSSTLIRELLTTSLARLLRPKRRKSCGRYIAIGSRRVNTSSGSTIEDKSGRASLKSGVTSLARPIPFARFTQWDIGVGIVFAESCKCKNIFYKKARIIFCKYITLRMLITNQIHAKNNSCLSLKY